MLGRVGLSMKSGRRAEPEPHRHHRRSLEPVFFEKYQRRLADAIGKQSNAQKVFLFGIVDRILQQFAAQTLIAKIPIDDEILEEDYKAAFRGANSEEQVNHPDDLAGTPQHKNSAPVGLFQQQS